MDISKLPLDNLQMKSTRSYMGPKYSVKYLGVVDGNMGILSRRMAMIPEFPKANGGSLRAAGSSLMNMSPEPASKKNKNVPNRATTE